jgi:CRISPR-associated exonuclease Cas4
MQLPFLSLAAIFIILALALLWRTHRTQKRIGLPSGRIIYTDTRDWGAVEQAFYDAEYGLTGKPDYLIERRGQLIPVEVKSSQVTASPYDAHIFQLAAYCLLVEKHYGKRPAYGIIHYPNRTFAIDYTAELESSLLDLLSQMRALDRKKEVHRSHDSVPRCSKCGYRHLCEQRLL